MSKTRRPVGQLARERLREAQRREAQALAAVEKEATLRDRVAARLAAAQVAPQRRLDEAEMRLSRARADLAEISGIERAAILLAKPLALVRADMRAARRDAKEPTEPTEPTERSGPAH